MFEAFWQATGEPPFADLTSACEECYRLTVQTSLSPEHRVYRMQRTSAGAGSFQAHFFVWGPGLKEASARTHEMVLDEPLWRALEVLLAVGRFWELPEVSSQFGLDGSTFTLEGWKAGRSHRVVRWSPNPIFSGGELFALVTDYLERLGELATLECCSEIRLRYVPEYVPTRQRVPRGNLA
jgi:hypothetical protein